MVLKQKEPAQESTGENSEETTQQKTVSKENPFGEETGVSEKSDSEKIARLASTNQEADWTHFETGGSKSGLDEATTMLIQSEFKNSFPGRTEKMV